MLDTAPRVLPASATRLRRKHLLIAGTGRAGTSFLVQFLTKLGLDTHISRFGDGDWDAAAQAGLEDGPPSATPKQLPYVLKSTWAHQFIDETLVEGGVEIEAAIIPVRDLVEAAASRTIVELRDRHARAPWMAHLNKTWDDWSHTPGGAMFSLNPIDQARLLAVGFHRLIERLVQADVPIVFLAFPRLVEDADYLFRKLEPALPSEITLQQARQSHREIADTELVRVGRELRRHGVSDLPNPIEETPTLEELDNIALRREIRRLRDRLARADAAAIGLPNVPEVQIVAGKYRVQGSNADGSAYSGTAVIAPRSDTTVCITWDFGSVLSGICVMAGGTLVGSHMFNGQVVLVHYLLQPDGSLKGTRTIVDQPGSGIEILTPA